jgi:hypothetical protein
MAFDQNGNWIDDTEYDTGYETGYEDPYAQQQGGLAGQYYTPEQLALMQQMLGQSQSFDPQMGMDPQMTGLFGGAAMPQMDTKGRVQPYDLGVQTQLTNFGQDIGSSIGNNMMAYMAGPGSYAPGALDPVYDEKPLQLTGRYKLEAARQAGGVQGVLADFMLGNEDGSRPPMTATQAAARVKAMLQDPAGHELSDQEAAEMKMELGETQPAYLGAKPETDWRGLSIMADSIYKPYLDDQAILAQPDVMQLPDGRVVQRTQNDSPQMEWLKKMGLPDPRAQYDIEYALQSDPTLSTMLGQIAQSQGDRDLMRKEFDERLKRTKKYRDEDIKNKAADLKEMDKFASATKQAMSEYFGAASRGQVQRPDMPASLVAKQTAALDPEMYNDQGLRREAYEEGPGGAPGWLKALPGNIAEGATGMGDYASQTLQRIAGKPAARPGAPTLPTNIGPLPNAAPTAPTSINGITLNLPNKPITSDMRQGLNPEGYSMMDTIMGRPMRDVVGAHRQRTMDESIPESIRKTMYDAKNQKMSKEQGRAVFEYMMRLAPTAVAGRQGRSPRTDAIQQRLAPLYQIGALGQRA